MTNTPSSGVVLGTQHNLPPAEQWGAGHQQYAAGHTPTFTETVGNTLHNLKEGVVHTGERMMEGLKSVMPHGMDTTTPEHYGTAPASTWSTAPTSTWSTAPTSTYGTAGTVTPSTSGTTYTVGKSEINVPPGSTLTTPHSVQGKPVVTTRMQDQ